MGSSLINLRKLEEIIPEFEAYLSGEGIKYVRERKKANDFLKVYLFEEEAIDSLDKETLKKLIDKLWVFSNCSDKGYILNEMLKSKLSLIRKSFKILIDENEVLAKRFDAVNYNVRMIDGVAISEILSHYNKNKYAIWDKKVLDSLLFLEVPESRLPFNDFQMEGKGYELYCQLLQDIMAEIGDYCSLIRSVSELGNLLLFLAGKDFVYVKQEKEDNCEKKEEQTNDLIDNNVVIKQVLQLGSELGFEVEKDIRLTSKYTIDAIWKGKIANLVITYAFEVLEKDANIKFTASKIADIMRLEPSIQKVIIVSYYSQFENLGEKLLDINMPKNSISYLNVNDLIRALKYLESLKKILDEIGLLKFNG